MPSEGTSTPPQFELVKVVNQPPVGACSLPNTLVKCSTGPGAGLYQCVGGQWTLLGPTIQSATVTITSAQLLAMTGLGVAPVAVVPAPGAGLMVLPLGIVVVFNPQTTPYVDNGGTFGFYLGPNVSPYATDVANNATGLGMTGTVPFVSSGGYDVSYDTVANQANQPVYFVIMGSSGGNTGVTDGDGTLTITTYYLVVPTN